MGTILDQALAYYRLGYTPLRVEPDSKASKSAGWQASVPTEDSIRRHFARPSNLGIRTGDLHPDGTCLVAIDIDLEDARLSDASSARSAKRSRASRGRKASPTSCGSIGKQRAGSFTGIGTAQRGPLSMC